MTLAIGRVTFTLSTHPHPPEFGHEPTDHAGCSVHTGVRIEPEDTQALERLARYILRPPISLERMQWNGRGEVSYRRKSGHDGPGRCVDEVIDPLDFLARVLMHIPEPRRHLVRYYGAYSNAARGRRRRASLRESACGDEPTASAADARDPDAKTLRRRWATLIKRVHEVDPLVCPSCGGEMRIIAFIVDPNVVDGILKHLARLEGRRPPRGPPERSDLAVVF